MPKKPKLDRKTSQQLYDYAVQQLGGPDAVLQQFYGERVRELLREGMTFGELLDEAASDVGLDHALRSMTLDELVGAPSGEARKRKAKGKKKFAKKKATRKRRAKQKHSPRLTSEERESLSTAICSILAKTPWIQVAELRETLAKHRSYTALGRDLSKPQFDSLVLGLREAKEIRTDDALGPKRLRYAHRSVKGPAPKPE